MWDNERQRTGNQKRTPLGYLLRGIAEFFAFIGLLRLLGMVACLNYKGVAGMFSASIFWLMTIPLVLGFIGEGMCNNSWRLAYRKEFHYDY